MKDPVARLPIERHPGGERLLDDVVVEEPMEIRVDGQPLAVLMRTPGADLALTAGFLHTEGVIEDAQDITAMAPCADPNKPHADNTILVALAAGCRMDQSRLERARRAFFASSSCGLCGKATIDNVLMEVIPRPAFTMVPAALIASLATRVSQPVFGSTGGLHAAALVTASGEVLARAEDIGRHNAVDKVIGQRLLQDQPVEGIIWVSGRAGFEVVQKAVVSGADAMVSVGAPSSLAVSLAQEARLTLIGFARDGRFNVYAGGVTPAPAPS
ncbi:MAG: FdhD protein [Myxococcota bacterium]|jgi:FdhD protein